MRRVTVRGIIIKDNKLFAQCLNEKTGEKRDYWSTPGGGLDDGESLHDGLKREMIEETGVEPVIGKLLFVQQFGRPEKEYIEFFFHITNAADYTNIDLNVTTHGATEVAECGFVDVSEVKVLPDFLQGVDLDKLLTQYEPTILNYL